MTFKEQIQQDLDTVFLNLDEFAELRRVEGKQIPVVVDNDQLVKLKQGQILGLVEADHAAHGKADRFSGRHGTRQAPECRRPGNDRDKLRHRHGAH